MLYTVMFVYDNGKVCVLANSRCGHQSMYEYFDLPIIKELSDKTDIWAKSSNKKVLVLRNPVERMWSGIGLFEHYVKPVLNLYDMAYEKGIDKIDSMRNFQFASLFLDKETRKENIEKLIFKDHCSPYLHNILQYDIDFNVIDFNRLHEYIPIASRTNITNCNNKSLDDFLENSIFTKEDMIIELESYNKILSKYPILSIDDWHLLSK